MSRRMRCATAGLIGVLATAVLATQEERQAQRTVSVREGTAARSIVDLDAVTPRVLVTAHRGAHVATGAPENSLAAIEAAIGLGVDIVEIDVRQTADGALVLMHDASVDRTTSGSGSVAAMTLRDIRGLVLLDDDGRATDPPLHVPTLDEALEAARDRVVLDLDVKQASVELLAAVIVEHDALDEALVFSGDFDYLLAMRRQLPEVAVLPRAHSAAEVETLLAKIEVPILHLDESFYDAAIAARILDTGTRVWMNALGEVDRLAAAGEPERAYGELLEAGANVIQTDRPGLLLEYLRARGLHP